MQSWQRCGSGWQGRLGVWQPTPAEASPTGEVDWQDEGDSVPKLVPKMFHWVLSRLHWDRSESSVLNMTVALRARVHLACAVHHLKLGRGQLRGSESVLVSSSVAGRPEIAGKVDVVQGRLRVVWSLITMFVVHWRRCLIPLEVDLLC